MSNNFGEIPEKDRELLDMALEGRSDTFKLRVYEITRKLNLDASDPSFLLLLSTGQLEAFLEQFPEKLEALFSILLGRFQQAYLTSETGLKAEISVLKIDARAANAANMKMSEDLLTAGAALQKFSSDQSDLLISRINKILTLAEEKRVELATEGVERETKERQKRGEIYKAVLQENAAQIIGQAGAALKGKHTKELILPLALGALFFSVGGLVCGKILGENQAREETGYKWGIVDYEINHRLQDECKKQNLATCNVHTLDPLNPLPDPKNQLNFERRTP